MIRQNGTVSSVLASLRSPFLARTLYRVLYRRADRIICQSASMAADLVAATGIPTSLIAVVPNPVDMDSIRAAVCEQKHILWTGPGPHLLAVGRLAREKGFDLLLNAFLLLKRNFPTADMAIAGAGPDETALLEQCRELGLNSSVRFLGNIDAPAQWFAGATLFVLSSRHEGLPNALLEAAAAGLPIVATPASGGLVDLLQQQPGVWLAGAITPAALANALIAALSALQPGQRFPHAFTEPFCLENAIPAYEQVIDATLAGVREAPANKRATSRKPRSDADAHRLCDPDH